MGIGGFTRPEKRGAPSRVVVLMTQHRTGAAALEWALGHAKSIDARVDVVVTGSDSPANPQYISPQSRRDLDERLRSAGVDHAVHEDTRDAAAKALALAEEVDADLLVVGIRGRSTTSKLLLGSVAQRLLMDARCPVVAVKAPTVPGA